jgi:hypothetical protein
MTKYTDSRNREISADTGVPISLPNYEQIESRKEFYCPYCQLKLSRLTDRSGLSQSWYCPKCVIDYPDQSKVKSRSSLSTPQKSNNENPAVAYPPEPGLRSKKIEIKGGLKSLQQKGVKVTSYVEGKG